MDYPQFLAAIYEAYRRRNAPEFKWAEDDEGSGGAAEGITDEEDAT